MSKKYPMSSSNGALLSNAHASISAGERGPLPFDNWRMFEHLAHCAGAGARAAGAAIAAGQPSLAWAAG